MKRSWIAALFGVLSLVAPALVFASDVFIVTVRHDVADFAAWKKVFDADEATRRKAGIQTVYVLRDADKPNVITVVHQSANLDKLKTFMAEPSLKSKMGKAGVKGAPEIRIGIAVAGDGPAR